MGGVATAIRAGWDLNAVDPPDRVAEPSDARWPSQTGIDNSATGSLCFVGGAGKVALEGREMRGRSINDERATRERHLFAG